MMVCNNIPVTVDKEATGFAPAFAARQVVGRVNSLAPPTSVLLESLPKPFLKPGLPDPLPIFEQICTMRHSPLELLQILTRVIRALRAKLDPPLGGAIYHFTDTAIGPPDIRTAPEAPQFFF
jgi:hypothetical protein